MKRILIAAAALSLFGCSSLMLQPADFSWPVESVLKADSKGMVSDTRFAVSFSIAPLMTAERGPAQNPAGATVRLIRDREGFYYITAPAFTHVYVFTVCDGGLKQYRKIEIGKTAMADPKLNQRDSFIELLNGSDKCALTKEGIMEGEKK